MFCHVLYFEPEEESVGMNGISGMLAVLLWVMMVGCSRSENNRDAVHPFPSVERFSTLVHDMICSAGKDSAITLGRIFEIVGIESDGRFELPIPHDIRSETPLLLRLINASGYIRVRSCDFGRLSSSDLAPTYMSVDYLEDGVCAGLIYGLFDRKERMTSRDTLLFLWSMHERRIILFRFDILGLDMENRVPYRTRVNDVIRHNGRLSAYVLDDSLQLKIIFDSSHDLRNLWFYKYRVADKILYSQVIDEPVDIDSSILKFSAESLLDIIKNIELIEYGVQWQPNKNICYNYYVRALYPPCFASIE